MAAAGMRSGVALILSPREEVMAVNKGRGEEIVYADPKKAGLKGVKENPRGYFLRRRRPAFYNELGSFQEEPPLFREGVSRWCVAMVAEAPGHGQKNKMNLLLNSGFKSN